MAAGGQPSMATSVQVDMQLEQVCGQPSLPPPQATLTPVFLHNTYPQYLIAAVEKLQWTVLGAGLPAWPSFHARCMACH